VRTVPRHNRPKHTTGDQPRPLSGGIAAQRRESGSDGDWFVRNVPGAHASKMYRCPGCDHEIPPGTAHVVTWPADDYGTIDDRRHWHQTCWSTRNKRGPSSRRW
jgi:hypothetical protein